MPRSADDHSGPTSSWGLPACFEATRVRQQAIDFHERDHDINMIAVSFAKARSRTHGQREKGRLPE